MKNFLKCQVVPILIFLLIGTGWSHARKFRVMTFNIRLENVSDGVNNWDNRKADDVAF